MSIIPEKSHRRRGRPSKAEEVRRVLAEIGIDPSAIDPLRILAGLAASKSTPATARVAACKVLLGVKDQDPAEDSVAVVNDVAARAIRLMAAARKAH
jgi:isopentenyldiphosphate isomerase